MDLCVHMGTCDHQMRFHTLLCNGIRHRAGTIVGVPDYHSFQPYPKMTGGHSYTIPRLLGVIELPDEGVCLLPFGAKRSILVVIGV